MTYSRGDIVIVKFPFALRDGKDVQKGRPALVVSDNMIERRYKDVILAAITSQVPPEVMELEMVLEPVKKSGLLKKSLLRLDFVMTLPEELISRKIGTLSEKRMKEVERKLKKLYGIK